MQDNSSSITYYDFMVSHDESQHNMPTCYQCLQTSLSTMTAINRLRLRGLDRCETLRGRQSLDLGQWGSASCWFGDVETVSSATPRQSSTLKLMIIFLVCVHIGIDCCINYLGAVFCIYVDGSTKRDSHLY